MFGPSQPLQLFVGGEGMSYLPYFCLFAYSGVRHILCCVLLVFLCFFSLSLVPYVDSFSGLSFFIVLSVFSNIYLVRMTRFL